MLLSTRARSLDAGSVLDVRACLSVPVGSEHWRRGEARRLVSEAAMFGRKIERSGGLRRIAQRANQGASSIHAHFAANALKCSPSARRRCSTHKHAAECRLIVRLSTAIPTRCLDRRETHARVVARLRRNPLHDKRGPAAATRVRRPHAQAPLVPPNNPGTQPTSLNTHPRPLRFPPQVYVSSPTHESDQTTPSTSALIACARGAFANPLLRVCRHRDQYHRSGA